jgi:hypothetical protein
MYTNIFAGGGEMEIEIIQGVEIDISGHSEYFPDRISTFTDYIS